MNDTPPVITTPHDVLFDAAVEVGACPNGHRSRWYSPQNGTGGGHRGGLLSAGTGRAVELVGVDCSSGMQRGDVVHTARSGWDDSTVIQLELDSAWCTDSELAVRATFGKSAAGS